MAEVLTRKIRLAYLVTHPIQYQAPLLREIAKDPLIDLTVFFCSDFSLHDYQDEGFGTKVKWDVPLLGGYHHEFLPAIGGARRLSLWRPWNHGIFGRLRRGRFDALWVHGYARPFHLYAMACAKILGIRVLLRDEATLISADRGATRKWVKSVFFTVLKRLCDRYLAIGKLNREYYRSYGISDDRIFTVPYAVDNHFFRQLAESSLPGVETLRKNIGLASDRPVILYASKLTHRKRAQDLLEAYVGLSPDGRVPPHPYLIYIGDGEMRESLESKVRDLGWEKSVRFLGFKNQSELPAYFALCDLFVLPSVREPWGLIVNEVMNAGKPVIVSDQVGSAPDLVLDGSNGWVFSGESVSELRDVLKKAFDPGTDLRAIGERARATVHSWGFREDVEGIRRALASLFV